MSCSVLIIDDAISDDGNQFEIQVDASFNQGEYNSSFAAPFNISRFGTERPQLNYTASIENNTDNFNSQ